MFVQELPKAVVKEIEYLALLDGQSGEDKERLVNSKIEDIQDLLEKYDRELIVVDDNGSTQKADWDWELASLARSQEDKVEQARDIVQDIVSGGSWSKEDLQREYSDWKEIVHVALQELDNAEVYIQEEREKLEGYAD